MAAPPPSPWPRSSTTRPSPSTSGARRGVPGTTRTAVLSPAEAYLMTSALAGVLNSGTGASARALGVTGDAAGKTGTTNDARDAWFVGYGGGLLAIVWVGFDDNGALGLSGAQAAL